MALPGFENVKKTNNNSFEDAYKVVEHKIQVNKQPTLPELRMWFIFKMEKEFDTKMLGTNTIYCYKTFNKVKEKYNLDNLQLALKINHWYKVYKKEYTGTFDFSSLNTNWLIEKLNEVPSYHIENDYKHDTTNRRI